MMLPLHTRTLALLEANNFFGLRRDQVTLMQQEKVPALVDAEGRMCAAGADDPYTILTKPHGHGDVHLLLHQTGLQADEELDELLEEFGESEEE